MQFVCVYLFYPTRTEEMLQKQTQLFLFNLLTFIHSTNTLYLWLIDEKERMERKRNYGLSLLSLSFCVTIFGISDWLEGSHLSKKGYDRVPWSFVFLKLPSSVYKASSSSKGECSFSDLSSPHWLSHRYNTLTLYSLWVLAELHALWIHWHPALMGFVNALCKWRSKERWWTSPLFMCGLQCLIRLHLQNTSSKIKSGISRQQYGALNHDHMAVKPLGKIRTVYGFLNCSMHQNPVEGWSKHRLLGTNPRVSDCRPVVGLKNLHV